MKSGQVELAGTDPDLIRSKIIHAMKTPGLKVVSDSKAGASQRIAEAVIEKCLA